MRTLSFGQYYSGDLASRSADLVVDDDVTEARKLHNLAEGIIQAKLEIVHSFGRSGGESGLQNLERGGKNKNAYSLGHLLKDGCRALDIDLQDDVASCLGELFCLSQRRTVKIAVNLSRLKKAALLFVSIELFLGNEMIMLSVLLAETRSTGRQRDGIADVRDHPDHFAD